MSQHRSCVCGTSDKKPYTIKGELYVLCEECNRLRKTPKILRIIFKPKTKAQARKRKIRNEIKNLGSVTIRAMILIPTKKNWLNDADLQEATAVRIKYLP